MRTLFWVLGLALLATSAPAQQLPLWHGLEAGPWQVGFSRSWVLDRSRVWERSPNLAAERGTVARPVRIDLWYPAPRGNCARMPFGGYLQGGPADPHQRSMEEVVERWSERSLRGFPGRDTTFRRLLELPTAACRDVPPDVGRHPLVVYSAGWYNRTPDNSVLAEYLASWGYVVATVPQAGPGLWTGDFSSNPTALETQMRDVEVALGQVTEQPFVDRSRVAVMGYSTGGTVALLVQGRNPLVDAVAALDPPFSGQDAPTVLASPYFGAYRNQVPILTLRAGHEDFVRRRPAALVLDSLHFAHRYTADVGRGTHGDFSDDLAIEAALALRRNEPRTTAEGIDAHRAVVLQVERFLAAVLRAGPAPPDAPAPAVAPVGPAVRLLVVERARVPGTAEWIARIQEHGAERAGRQLAELRSRYPRATLVIESEVNGAGYRLLREGKAAAAVAVFRFNTLAHPRSANAYDSLADGCRALGDRACEAGALRSLLAELPADGRIPADVKDRMRAAAQARVGELRP